MIRNSFIFLDKVGQKKEQQIWKQGIETWQDFLNSKIKGISPLIKKKHDQMIRLAKLNLCYENPGFFKDFMEHGEMWRIYPEFKDKAVYLDIETSGWNITCIGLYNGQEVKHFIRGINLNKKDFLDELYKYKVVITFNGSSFDIPMLNKYFNHDIKLAHIDLRHVCSKIGLNGGLKKIEKKLKIKRDKEVQSMLGNEAVYCWEMWQHTGKRKYLDLLIKYNTEDIVNLEPLAEYSIKKLWKKVKI
ncbi:MAG: ribonuclease H-like domain-containing protein [Nanoarchaeota archaeon]|nr:ribonuclease H-like domain-containing protein [Nanoarchaeota archaeon]